VKQVYLNVDASGLATSSSAHTTGQLQLFPVLIYRAKAKPVTHYNTARSGVVARRVRKGYLIKGHIPSMFGKPCGADGRRGAEEIEKSPRSHRV
jgi:hypothetical protein